MKKLLLILFSLPMIFNSCSEQEQTISPPIISSDYITDCNVTEFDITFNGTNFWDSDNGWFSIDGTKSYCFKTVNPNSTLWTNTTMINNDSVNLSGISISNKLDGTKDLRIDLSEKLTYGDFHIRFSIEEIDNISAGQTIQINSDNVVAVIDHSTQFNCDINITFSTIDILNYIYEGNMSLTYSPSAFENYEQGESLNFSAVINNFHFEEDTYEGL